MNRKPKRIDATFDKDHKGRIPGAAFGTAGGAILGGALGSLAGPGGTVAGALAGAAAGGAVGHAVGAGSREQEEFWRANFRQQAFYEPDLEFDDYATAFRLGGARLPGLHLETFDLSEPGLRAEWEKSKGKSRLSWEQARHAVRAAWDRTADRESESASGRKLP